MFNSQDINNTSTYEIKSLKPVKLLYTINYVSPKYNLKVFMVLPFMTWISIKIFKI